jgi:hypothetical protein
MQSSRKLGVALLLAGIGWFLGHAYWIATRTRIPLDMPISLSRGHIRTDDFQVNLASGYYVEIEVQNTPTLPNLECLMWGCYESPAALRAQWTLLSTRGAEGSGSTDHTNGASGLIGTVGRKVGYFRSTGGRYRLDLDVLSDTAMLNAGNPRLKVEADGNGYNRISGHYDLLPFGPLILVVIGGTLLLLSRVSRG